jgi:hypothetical protein
MIRAIRGEDIRISDAKLGTVRLVHVPDALVTADSDTNR